MQKWPLIACAVLFCLGAFVYFLSFYHGALYPSFFSVNGTHLAAYNGRVSLYFGGDSPFSGGGILHDASGNAIWATASSGHFAGVYFARFSRPGPFSTFWTFDLPLGYLLLLSCILPLV